MRRARFDREHYATHYVHPPPKGGPELRVAAIEDKYPFEVSETGIEGIDSIEDVYPFELADVVKQKKAAEGTYWAKAKAKAGVVVSAGGSVLSKAPGVSVFNRSSNRLDPEKEKAKDKEDKVGAS
eukprot:1194850-Prorocentrum_minimum.AAC.7